MTPVTKDNAPCCQAKRDSLGRPPIGYCGPDCTRRPAGVHPPLVVDRPTLACQQQVHELCPNRTHCVCDCHRTQRVA